MPPRRSRAARLSFAIATVVLLAALALQAVGWVQRGAADWAVMGNIVGLLMVTGVGAFDLPPGPLQRSLTLVGLGMLLVSASWFFYTRL